LAAPRIAVFAALDWECRAVLTALRGVRRARVDRFRCWEGRAAGSAIVVVKTGVGPTRAAAAARATLGLAPVGEVVSAGCAGGLDPTLMAGDLVIASAVHDDCATAPAVPDAAARARALAAAGSAGLRACEGALLCSSTPLLSAEAKRGAAAAGAIAVEMEAAPIAALAAVAGIPFLSVRAILDGAGDQLPADAGVIDPDSGAVRPLALAAWAATHPGAVLALRRMQRAAQDSLERFFRAWLGSRP
jgi:nucleoside phosphorylase